MPYIERMKRLILAAALVAAPLAAQAAAAHADLVVTDPVQAGVMAVMAIASTASFDIDRVRGHQF